MAEKDLAWQTAYEAYVGSVGDTWSEFQVTSVGVSNIIPNPWPFGPNPPQPCLACQAPARTA